MAVAEVALAAKRPLQKKRLLQSHSFPWSSSGYDETLPLDREWATSSLLFFGFLLDFICGVVIISPNQLFSLIDLARAASSLFRPRCSACMQEVQRGFSLSVSAPFPENSPEKR
jgi:hypothetical protein